MRSAWLLAVPGTCVLLSAVLALSAAAERRLLSPRKLILGVARARRSTPEFAEAFVARQFDLLLEQEPRLATATAEPRPSPAAPGASGAGLAG